MCSSGNRAAGVERSENFRGCAFANQTFAPTQPRDRRAIPPFAARARSPAETRFMAPSRSPEKIEARGAPKNVMSLGVAPGLARTASFASWRRGKARHLSGTSALEKFHVPPAQNRGFSFTADRKVNGLQHRSLLAQARPSRESCCPSGLLGASPHHFFRKLREREEPDRPFCSADIPCW